MTVVVPTLTGGEKLEECVEALQAQGIVGLDVVIVDNGSLRLGERFHGHEVVRVLSPGRNLGFAGAVADAFESSAAPYFMTINDDAVAEPGCLAALIQALERDPAFGSCAPKIVLAGENLLDSAGMAIGLDGSSRQRGHRRDPDGYRAAGEVLFASGCAAMYRREALADAGGFDRDFFLYCEDTDVGLRMRRMGWRCRYEPAAVVRHKYSATAGGGSASKVYYAERNRIAVLVKNFPWDLILMSPAFTLARYAAHVRALASGKGYAGQVSGGTTWGGFVGAVLKGMWDAFTRLPTLLKRRSQLMRRAKLTSAEFRRVLKTHRLSASEIAGV